MEERKIVVEENGQQLSLEACFDTCTRVVPLPCYLAYIKLKSLDYIVVRHCKQVAVFEDETALLRRMKEGPDRFLLDEAVSFDLFRNESTWTKSRAADMTPVGRVVVT